jgi:hypothetical protein
MTKDKEQDRQIDKSETAGSFRVGRKAGVVHPVMCVLSEKDR